MDPTTLDLLQRFNWPGNVRELENAIERAVLMHDGELLLPQHINSLFQSIAPIIGNDTLTPGPELCPCPAHGPEKLDLHNPAA